jgi:hypothetical protein
MARRPQAKATPPAPPVQAEPVLTPSDIIPDGDFAGMTYEDVMAMTEAAVNDAYANLSIEGVCAVHDMVLAEILAVAKDYKSPAFAHEAAIRFGQTLMPYLTTPTPTLNKAWGELMRIRSSWEPGDENE